MFIQWKTYLLILCLTGSFFYPVLSLAQLRSEVPLEELSDSQLGQQLNLYSAINLDDLSVRDEPLFREAFQRLLKRGYSLTMDDLAHFLFVTDDAPSRMAIALNTPDVPLEELSNEDLAKRIDFYPSGPASLFVELNADQHIRQGFERVSAYYSEYVEPYINDAPTLSKMLRLLDQAMAISVLPDYGVGSIFQNTDYEQLQRIEPLVSIPTEDGYWSLDFYRQYLPEGHQLSGMELIEQFSTDVQMARTFIEASRRLKSEDVKELSDKDLAIKITLFSPSILPPLFTEEQQNRSLFYPLFGLPTRLIGLDRYIEEGLKRASAYYGNAVREHMDNALTLSKVLKLLDHSKNQVTQLRRLSDMELGQAVDALNLSSKQIKRLRKLAKQRIATDHWPLDFYIRQLSEDHQLSGMDLIEEFDRDIQRASLLMEGLVRLLDRPLLSESDASYLTSNGIKQMAENLPRLYFLINDLGLVRSLAVDISYLGWLDWQAVEGLFEGGHTLWVEIDAQMLGKKPKNAIRIYSLWMDDRLASAMILNKAFSSQVNTMTEGKEPNVVLKQRLIMYALSQIRLNEAEVIDLIKEAWGDELLVRVLEETEFIKSRFPLPSCPVDRVL